jgi:MFS family permease
VLRELRGGWREVRSRSWVWVTIAVFAGALFCVLAPWLVLGPILARDLYGAASVFGVLSTLVGVGALCGAIAATRWRPRRPLRAGLILILAWPVLDIVFALRAPLWIVVPTALLMGVGWALLGVYWETALARYIPPRALSRVSAYDWMGSLVLLPVGYVVAGPLAAALGARTVLGVGGVIGFLLLALALLPRETRELGGDDALAAPQASSSRAMSV